MDRGSLKHQIRFTGSHRIHLSTYPCMANLPTFFVVYKCRYIDIPMDPLWLNGGLVEDFSVGKTGLIGIVYFFGFRDVRRYFNRFQWLVAHAKGLSNHENSSNLFFNNKLQKLKCFVTCGWFFSEPMFLLQNFPAPPASA